MAVGEGATSGGIHNHVTGKSQSKNKHKIKRHESGVDLMGMGGRKEKVGMNVTLVYYIHVQVCQRISR